ncbi:MAG: hypothetical protein EU549_03495 [Promethearchaeota archaeon]|nr:MAG: hypothetical protein EU549_03495 [Candidatus Lokiarchaeota archaeon]
MLLDDPMISNIVFYPRKHKMPEKLDDDTMALKFQVEKNILIGGFHYINDRSLPNMLMFHGNGEIALEYQYFKSLFFSCGVNLAVMDFRGYGFSSGTPIFSSLYADALPVYRQFEKYLEENDLCESIFVLGRSLGSHCAAEIGSHNPKKVRGIIFESAIGSTYKVMKQLFRVNIPNMESAVRAWSNDTRAEKFRKPTLIIRGSADRIVPKEHGKILYDAIPDVVDKRLITIAGAGHNNIFQFKEEYFEPLKKFIETYK